GAVAPRRKSPRNLSQQHMIRFNLLDDDFVTVSIIAPAVQWLLVAKVRGIYHNSI
ncbi:hypothetical protein HMPREF9478_00872, partial [Enterococcus saccharolyticus 30_1]